MINGSLNAPMVFYEVSADDAGRVFGSGGILEVTILGVRASVEFKKGDNVNDVVQRLSAKLVDLTDYPQYRGAAGDKARAELQQMVRDFVLKKE